MTDCVLLYGDHRLPCLHKSAGPHRLATELRDNDFSVQLIDISGVRSNHPVIKRLIDKFVDNNTSWIGISGTFMFHVFNTQFKKFKNLTDKNTEVSQELLDFMEMCREKNPNIKLFIIFAENNPKDFATSLGVKTYYTDGLGVVQNKFGVKEYPVTILVSGAKNLMSRIEGYKEKKLQESIARALEKR